MLHDTVKVRKETHATKREEAGAAPLPCASRVVAFCGRGYPARAQVSSVATRVLVLTSGDQRGIMTTVRLDVWYFITAAGAPPRGTILSEERGEDRGMPRSGLVVHVAVRRRIRGVQYMRCGGGVLMRASPSWPRQGPQASPGARLPLPPPPMLTRVRPTPPPPCWPPCRPPLLPPPLPASPGSGVTRLWPHQGPPHQGPAHAAACWPRQPPAPHQNWWAMG